MSGVAGPRYDMPRKSRDLRGFPYVFISGGRGRQLVASVNDDWPSTSLTSTA